MADVHVPLIGSIPKWGLYAGIGGSALVVVYVIRSRKSAASSATTASAAGNSGVAPSGELGGDPYPPDGTTGNPSDPYSTDPSTGETYGDEDSGYGAYDADAGLDAELADQDTGEGATTTTTATGSTAPATPQEWVQDVTTTLSGLGWDSQTVATACGAYIAGQTLTADQASIIQTALAEVPYPGTAPPVKTSQASPTVKVPNFTGSKAATAARAASAAGLKLTGNNVPKGKTGTVTSQSPKAGETVKTGTTVAVKLKIT